MGREIRRVPKGWQHPENTDCRHHGGHRDPDIYKRTDYQYGRCFIPMHDEDYQTASQEWIKNFELWQAGKHPDQVDYCKYYWEYDSPPDEKTCRPAFESEPTCYQIYETVSEGTPVSPVFETLQELEDYLVSQGHSREAAHAFSQDGWAPSFVLFNPGNGEQPTILDGIDSAALPRK